MYQKEVHRMTSMMRYDPFREVLSLRDAMNELFTQSFVRPGWLFGSNTTPVAPVNIYETERGYQMYVLLPGVKPEDVELSVEQNTLTIRGQVHPFVEQDKQVKWIAQEIGQGTFERMITFPKAIDPDKIETSYEYGVLSLWVPISEASLPKKIAIKSCTLNGHAPEKLTVEAGTR